MFRPLPAEYGDGASESGAAETVDGEDMELIGVDSSRGTGPSFRYREQPGQTLSPSSNAETSSSFPSQNSQACSETIGSSSCFVVEARGDSWAG